MSLLPACLTQAYMQGIDKYFSHYPNPSSRRILVDYLLDKSRLRRKFESWSLKLVMNPRKQSNTSNMESIIMSKSQVIMKLAGRLFTRFSISGSWCGVMVGMWRSLRLTVIILVIHAYWSNWILAAGAVIVKCILWLMWSLNSIFFNRCEEVVYGLSACWLAENPGPVPHINDNLFKHQVFAKHHNQQYNDRTNIPSPDRAHSSSTESRKRSRSRSQHDMPVLRNSHTWPLKNPETEIQKGK